MHVKPSAKEQEYFARQEVARRRKSAMKQYAALLLERREQARALHLMKCP